jgi:hypothetical protein
VAWVEPSRLAAADDERQEAEEAIKAFIDARRGVYSLEEIVAEFGNPSKGYSQDYLEILRAMIDDGTVPMYR